MKKDGLKPINHWFEVIIRFSLRREIVALMALLFIAAFVQSSQNTDPNPLEFLEGDRAPYDLADLSSNAQVHNFDESGLDEQVGFGLNSFNPIPVNASLTMIVGSAVGHLLDSEDETVAPTQDPDLSTIVSAIFPMIIDAESVVKNNLTYEMTVDDVRAQIYGHETGHYSILRLDGTNRGHAVFGVECDESTIDTFEVRYTKEDPRNCEMNFGTWDQRKEYGAAEIIQVDQELRMFIVSKATVLSDTEVVISTSLDGHEMIFTNDGPHALAFDVQIGKNRIIEDGARLGTYQLDGWSMSPSREIVIDPYQTIIIYPNDWNDLESTRIVFEDGELVIGIFHMILWAGCAVTSFGVVGYWISEWNKRDYF